MSRHFESSRPVDAVEQQTLERALLEFDFVPERRVERPAPIRATESPRDRFGRFPGDGSGQQRRSAGGQRSSLIEGTVLGERLA
ncbi:hypothetical protein DSM3645_03868 [Blastopirellula marina DSM 3645]|uniref:Uncharacterized protein n=1 Tax=Blastopirellula marina DSM 3645 TaxID=314230 RepID=A3ZV74_9BACT|nr:hypothetical protein DSM3645_03868 [Blastopirellula marina DSM 3645]